MPTKKTAWVPETPEKRKKTVRISNQADMDDDVQIIGVWRGAQPLPSNFSKPKKTYVEINGYKDYVNTPEEIIKNGESKEEIIDLT